MRRLGATLGVLALAAGLRGVAAPDAAPEFGPEQNGLSLNIRLDDRYTRIAIVGTIKNSSRHTVRIYPALNWSTDLRVVDSEGRVVPFPTPTPINYAADDCSRCISYKPYTDWVIKPHHTRTDRDDVFLDAFQLPPGDYSVSAIAPIHPYTGAPADLYLGALSQPPLFTLTSNVIHVLVPPLMSL
jgi:hypothetical protein